MNGLKKKFIPAFHGMKLAAEDPSIRIQLILAALAVIVGFVLQLSSMEWIAVLICIGLVLCTEILNTAVEKLCNLYTEKTDERIRVIKDLAAGAVLSASVIALICAMVILVRHLI
ncbi:MAG: diacylglycerol kinase family protein [Solobacterium sp.]|jgi:undecaprenol kinase/diacylglycerol kinase (ATP)|nr:diacylglycerol kinase family protein [Solobacterium sp.]MCH4222968.1 diacylglycerol kinase family protein [Solobacterium sp.]MCH4266377.1 diacylglycerol kinase family protein [Solobacterium sp.]